MQLQKIFHNLIFQNIFNPDLNIVLKLNAPLAKGALNLSELLIVFIGAV